MRTSLLKICLLCPALLAAAASARENRHDWAIGLTLDARSAAASAKLAAEPDAGFARLAFVYTGAITPTLEIDAVVDAVDDGTPGIDVTEAFLAWHPVPRSPFTHRLRVGAFYPPLSLENSEPDWTSPYAGTFSAINTWVGEELRAAGAEWSVSRALGPRARQRELRFLAAGYYANDPAGALLSWRGWAMHERQSRLGDAITLPVLPQIAPGMMFSTQALATEPFVETDHRPGYYFGAEFLAAHRARLTAVHYDNHADPVTVRDGQYGWTTRFDHVGLKLELPAGLGLIAQWMDGTTIMGPAVAPAAPGYHVVDNAFAAWFGLLTRQQGPHRWTLRYDDFAVVDRDRIPLDDNGETGDALTLAWRYSPRDDWSVGLEWQRLQVERPAFAYAGAAVAQRERLLSLEVRYRLARAE